jgi:hypothetical protein
MAAAPAPGGGAALQLARLDPPALTTGQPGVLRVHLAAADAAALRAAAQLDPLGSAVEVVALVQLQGSQLLAHHSVPLLELLLQAQAESEAETATAAAPVVLVPVPPVTAPSQVLVLVTLASGAQPAPQAHETVGLGVILALPEPAARELEQLQLRVRQELQQPGVEAAAGKVAAQAWRLHLQPLLADVGGLLAGPAAAEVVVAAGGQHPLQVGGLGTEDL